MFDLKWIFVYDTILMLLNAYVFISCLVVRVFKEHFGVLSLADVWYQACETGPTDHTWKFNKPCPWAIWVQICAVLCSAAPNCYQNTALPGLGVIFSTYGEKHAGKASRKEAAVTSSASSSCSGPNSFCSKNDG